ncbi:uncharacterized protein LOC144451417 [Glandiceps talaboti]
MFPQQNLVVRICFTVFYMSLVTVTSSTESDQLQEYKRCYKTNPDKRTFKHNDIKCNLCYPGQFMVAPCTGTGVQSTRCAQCLQNTYMPYYNECDDCWSCTAVCDGLNQIAVQECNGTHPRVCGCLEGTHPSASNDRCIKYECPAGQRVRVKNGRFGIDVKCRPCPANSYSSGINTRTFCTPHTNCTVIGREFVFKGNGTHNAVCEGEGTPTPVPRGTDNIMELSTEWESLDLSSENQEENDAYTHKMSSDKTLDDSPTTEVPQRSNTTNRIKPYPSDHNNTIVTNAISIGIPVGVSITGILVFIAIIIIIFCYCKYCAKKPKQKRKYSVPLSVLKKRKISTSSSESEQENIPKPVWIFQKCFARQRSTGDDISRESLLQKSITLKRVSGKTYDNVFSDFIQAIAKGVEITYWQEFLRTPPPPYLTKADIGGIEYQYNREPLSEIVYQCLLLLKKGMKQEDNPVKNILLKLAAHDKKLMKNIFRSHCEYETVSRESAVLRNSISED